MASAVCFSSLPNTTSSPDETMSLNISALTRHSRPTQKRHRYRDARTRQAPTNRCLRYATLFNPVESAGTAKLTRLRNQIQNLPTRIRTSRLQGSHRRSDRAATDHPRPYWRSLTAVLKDQHGSRESRRHPAGAAEERRWLLRRLSEHPTARRRHGDSAAKSADACGRRDVVQGV